MTNEELATMELMWLRRIPISKIADTLGYGVSTIQHYAKVNRDRFPMRRRPVDEDAIWPAARQVLDGERRVLDVARELNVSEESVMKRVRMLRRHGEQKQ